MCNGPCPDPCINRECPAQEADAESENAPDGWDDPGTEIESEGKI